MLDHWFNSSTINIKAWINVAVASKFVLAVAVDKFFSFGIRQICRLKMLERSMSNVNIFHIVSDHEVSISDVGIIRLMILIFSTQAIIVNK